MSRAEVFFAIGSALILLTSPTMASNTRPNSKPRNTSTSRCGGLKAKSGYSSQRRRADDAENSSTFTEKIENSLSTKITPDGKACLESDGYNSNKYDADGSRSGNNDDNLEELWVEFDYQLETPMYVQYSFNSRDRIEAVEHLMHDTLEDELLGCNDNGIYAYTDAEGNSFAAMPRFDMEDTGVMGMDLVAGINTSPTDVQVGICEPQGMMDECRHMRGFVIVLLKQNSKSSSGTSKEMMEEARAQVREETLRIITGAIDRGIYNGRFANEVFIARITMYSGPKPDSLTIQGDGYEEGAFGEEGNLTQREKMSTGKAYGIIFISGVAVIMVAVAILITKAYRDGRRRRYSKRRRARKHNRHKDGGENNKSKKAHWDTTRIVDVETESTADDDDLEVTLWMRSPRNGSARKRSEDMRPAPSPRVSPREGENDDEFGDHVCNGGMALYVKSPRNSQRKIAQFNLYECKKSTDKDGNKRDDEGTEATEDTVSISQITHTVSISQITHSIGCVPIYEEETEV